MKKRIFAILFAVMLLAAAGSCSFDKDRIEGNSKSTSVTATESETRIHNNFKDLLPKFDFDSEPVESYREAISYSFTAECSKKGFEKYVDKVKEAGFNVKTVEANGYFMGYNSDNYFVEMTLIDGNITVFIKSA